MIKVRTVLFTDNGEQVTIKKRREYDKTDINSDYTIDIEDSFGEYSFVKLTKEELKELIELLQEALDTDSGS